MFSRLERSVKGKSLEVCKNTEKRPSRYIIPVSAIMLFACLYFLVAPPSNHWNILSASSRKVTDFASFIKSPLPFQNLNISVNNPVVLFHQRKAGGSSLRSVLFKASQQLNLSHFIPCYGSVPCDTYTFKGSRNAIYAGHFPIQEVKHLLRHVPMHSDFSSIQKHNFTCLSNFRDPVARVESCFYFRFLSRGIKFKCISEVPLSTLKEILLFGVDHYGDGCLDEPFRILSGLADKTLIRKSNDIRSVEFQIAYQNSLHWIARCIPLILDDDRTNALVNYFIPQLRSFFSGIGHENKNHNTKCPLNDTHLSLLHSLTEGERLLFKQVKSRFEYLYQTIHHSV